MIVKELLTRLGFELDEAALDRYEEATNGAVKAMKGLMLLTSAAALGFAEMVREAGELGERMELASLSTKVTTEELLKWNFLSRRIGINFDQVSHAIEMMSARAGQALINGGEELRSYAYLGIGFDQLRSKNPGDLLMSIVTGLSKIKSANVQAGLGMQTLGRGFIDLLPLIRKGPEEIRAAFEEFDRLDLGLTEAQVHNLATFNDALEDLQAIVGSVRNQIAAEFAPALVMAIDRWKEWWTVNKDLVKVRVFEFIKLIVSVLLLFWQIGGKVIDVIAQISDHLGGMENALRLLAILWAGVRIGEMITGLIELARAFKAAETAAAVFDLVIGFLPILLGAAIAGVYLLWQDFEVWKSGKGKSVLGKFLGDYQSFDAQFGDLFSKEKGLRIGMEFGAAIGEGIWMGVKAGAGAFFEGGKQGAIDFWNSLIFGRPGSGDKGIRGIFDSDNSDPLAYLGSRANVNALNASGGSSAGFGAPMLQAPITVVMAPGATADQANYVGGVVSSHVTSAWELIERDFPWTEPQQR